MSKWIVCGSFENPNKAKQYARFSSKLDYTSEQEAIEELEKWTEQAKYPFIWVEKVGK